MAGPLTGIRVLEAGGIGPAPFCGMLLSDLGAEVIQIVRPGTAVNPHDVPGRGRLRITLDLRSPAGLDAALALADAADLLIEGFRPGVMERLGLGPDVCLQRNPRLVYGRMTGWGQSGPLSQAAGHDLNYIALSGALHAMGSPEQPPPVPLNLIGDYGGGAMLLAVGLLAALQERHISGRGQVIDAAMSDGSALLSSLFYGMRETGRWRDVRGGNHLDGGAHFYNNYRCSDGRFIAVAATEPQFHAQLRALCGLEHDRDFDEQWDRSRWPRLKARLAQVFATRTRDEWCQRAEDFDACISPVLDWSEAPQHPHHRERGSFFEANGIDQPAPAPRFSRTPVTTPRPAVDATDECLRRWGLPQRTLDALRRAAGTC